METVATPTAKVGDAEKITELHIGSGTPSHARPLIRQDLHTSNLDELDKS